MQRLVAIMCGVPQAAAEEIAVDAGTRPPRGQQLMVTAESSHCWHGHLAVSFSQGSLVEAPSASSCWTLSMVRLLVDET